MSKNPGDRNVGGHIKEGLKNIGTTYKALVKNAPSNVKLIVKGKLNDNVDNKISPGSRAKIAGMGAMGVTPVGPIAAFGLGVKKSVEEKKKAVEFNKPENKEKRALEEGKVIKKNVPTLPPNPKPQSNPQAQNNPLRQAQTEVTKPNQFAKKVTPSQNVQPGQKSVMGTKRTPPNNTNKK